MNIDDFSWHPYVSPSFDEGLLLRCGGPEGEVYAAISGKQGEPWLTLFNLHLDAHRIRSALFLTEMEAIEAVETWLETLRARH